MKFVTDILAKANLVVDGSVILNTTPNAIVDTDKFLVQDGATVKYRTGAEVLSDIGAQGLLTLTVIGNSGPATLIGNGLNIPTYSLAGLGGVPLTRTLTINGTSYDLSADRTWSVGTVTSVDMSVPTGFAISGNPITTTGTLALAFASGYSLPSNATQANWSTAYDRSITAFSYSTSTGVLTITKQDTTTLTATVTLQPFTTTNLVEGTNLYYTDARARLALSAGTGISYDNLTGIITNSDPGSAQSIFKNIAVATQNTIVADNNNDTLTVAAGTAISITTDDTTDTLTITNVLPDQIVSLTGAGTTSISGTYPNFTITSNDQYVGTVTSFSAGNLSPLFTTSVATSTTTPALSFNLNTQNANTVFAGPISGGAAAPTFRALTATDIPALSYVSSISVTAPLTTTGGLTPTLAITQAGVASDGYLSSTDWNTFNNKQDALTLTTTGNSGSSTLIGATLNIPTYTLSGLGGVPSTRTINGLALSADQTFATGTTGTDFNIVSAGTVHTFNIPDASSTARGFLNATTQTINGTKTFLNSPIVPSLYLTNMGAGSGAVYYNVSENRLTVANYNVGGEIKFEVNGGVYTMTLNSDLTIELSGYTTNGFLKTSGSNGLLVVDTTSYTPTTRTLTINGVAHDLSADRTWSVGTVTSVDMSVPTGFAISGNPVTSSGTLALSFASGYSLPTNASQSNWDAAYTGRIASLTTTGTSGAATLSSNVLNIPQYQAQGNYITALTGEATASGPGSASVTLSNSAVTGKVLTGLTVTGGTIASTDSILQAFGKVQNQINGLIGGLKYQGTWNASTNTPTITSGSGTDGHFYIVSVAGSTNIDGVSDWQIGDWIVFHSPVWQKVDNTDSVTSVNGFTGAVTLTTSNISEGTNLYYTDARARQAISLTTTGSSGAATYSNVTGVLNIPQYTLSGLGGVPTSRTITINGVAQDLSADRTWSVGTVTSIATTGPITGGTITSTGTIGITQSTTSTDGYLSSTDWNTFNNKQNAITLTTTGSSGSATLVGATLNIPNYTLSGLGGVPTTRQLTINGITLDLSADRTWSVGTVTSITFSGPLTGGTITGSGTVGILQASGSQNGYLSSTDWTTFNSKEPAIAAGTTAQYWRGDKSWQTLNTTAVPEGTNLYYTDARARAAITLTTTGTSGAATYNSGTGVLNIPQYQSVLTNPVTGTGTTNYVARWTSSSTIGTGVLYDNGTNVGISTTSPSEKFQVGDGTGTGSQYARFYHSATDLYIGQSGGTIFGYSAGTASFIVSVQSSYLFAVGTRSSQPLTFATNDVERARVTATGNIGINTTSPDGRLHSLESLTWSSGNSRAVTADNTTTFANGASTGTVSIAGTAAILNAVFSGGATIGSGGRVGAVDAILTVGNSTSGTITLTQASNIRALSAGSFATYFNPTGATTITHLAGIRVLPDINTGAGAVTITNKYGVLIGDASGGTGSISYTNRWGIYQEGASDTNYFAASVLIGTTANAGYKLDVSGTGRFNSGSSNVPLFITSSNSNGTILGLVNTNSGTYNWGINGYTNGNLYFQYGTLGAGSNAFYLTSAGAGIFSSSVTASSFVKTGGTSSQYLMADGSVSTLSNPTTGTGTANYLARWTGTSTLGTGTVQDDGTYVGIGTTPISSYKVDVSGNIRLSTGVYTTGYTTYSLTGYSLSPTNFNVGYLYQNSIATFDGSSALTVNTYRSQPEYTLTGVGANSLALQPFLAYPVVNLTGANARVDATGFTAYIWRTNPADVSTNGSNRLRGAYVIVGNRGGNGITATPYTNTVVGYESSIENGGGTVNNMFGIRTYSWQGEFAANSTTNNWYGVYQGMTIGAASGGVHTVTNFYAFYQDTPSVLATGVLTNRWGLYFTDSSMPSYHAGNLLVGTNTNAGYKLDVAGSGRFSSTITSTNGGLLLQGSAANSSVVGLITEGSWPWRKLIDTETSQNSYGEYIDGNVFYAKRIDFADRNSAISGVGTNIYTLNLSTGAATFSSSVTCVSLTETSSRKIKENIISLDGSLTKVEKLRPVSYNRIGSSTTEIGLVAEEVEEVYPEFVEYDQHGNPVGIHYSRLTAVLIESVKELKKEITELKNRN